MTSIEILMAEHRNIERVLDSLDTFADRVDADGLSDPASLAKFVDFIANYADHSHHGKEEDILFTAMNEIGFPSDGGPVGVMLAEHDQGRGLVAALRGASQTEGTWDETQRNVVVNAARGFSSLLRQHIMKEDQVLYPMAMSNFDQGLRDRVDGACAAYDASHTSEVKTLLALADDLNNQFPATG